MVDPSSGLPYWMHAHTGVSQWEPPKWVDQMDLQTGRIYYVNNNSGIAQWEIPADFEVIVRHRHGQVNHISDVSDGGVDGGHTNIAAEHPHSFEKLSISAEVSGFLEPQPSFISAPAPTPAPATSETADAGGGCVIQKPTALRSRPIVVGGALAAVRHNRRVAPAPAVALSSAS